MHWCRHEETVEDGICREFEQKVIEMGAAVPESQSFSHEIDSQYFKLVADQMVSYEANLYPMLNRSFVAPVMEGDTINGIITESNQEEKQFLQKE